jgi:hypothetical protein
MGHRLTWRKLWQISDLATILVQILDSDACATHAKEYNLQQAEPDN